MIYPLSLGLHSQTDIVAAINDLNARLTAIEASPSDHTPIPPGCFDKLAQAANLQPAPGDDAAVGAIASIIENNPVGYIHRDDARSIVTAIRAGHVPGLCDPRHVSGLYDKAQAEIAALKAKLEATAFDDWQHALRECDQLRAERDKALARVAELENALDATHKRFSEEAGNVYQLRSDLAAADECAKKANDEHSRTRARLVDERDAARAELAEAKALLLTAWCLLGGPMNHEAPPNAKGQPAATEPAQHDGRGPLGCADLLGADVLPEGKP